MPIDLTTIRCLGSSPDAGARKCDAVHGIPILRMVDLLSTQADRRTDTGRARRAEASVTGCGAKERRHVTVLCPTLPKRGHGNRNARAIRLRRQWQHHCAGRGHQYAGERDQHPAAHPTPKPTATPTPGHLLVTVHPNPPGNYGIQGTTGDATCHSGSTCTVNGPCTSPDWPTIILSNSGQVALTWHASVTSTPGGWGLSATSGTIGGGAAVDVSISNGPGGGGATYVFTGPAQTVTLDVGCGAG